mgnify:CR=1 FL=1
MPMQLDTSKICFITNVSQEKQYENCVSYIRRLTVPVGMTVEFRAIRDAKSMCEGYARAQSSSDAKYKIYLHQDVMITDENFLYTLISTFQSNASYGIAGLVGVYNLPQNAVWWTSFDSNKVGVTIDTVYPEGETPIDESFSTQFLTHLPKSPHSTASFLPRSMICRGELTSSMAFIFMILHNASNFVAEA